MKTISLFIIGIILACVSCTNKAGEPEKEIGNVSYSLGLNEALNIKQVLKKQGMDTIIDIDLFCKAFRDVFEGNDLDISEEESMQILQEYFLKITEEEQDKRIKDETEFLAKNAKKEGVITTESGLQYEILSSGDGDKPIDTDSVKIRWNAVSKEGEVRYNHSTITHLVDKLPEGMKEAVQLMSLNDKWRLTLPNELWFKPELIIMEIELLEIIKK